MPSSLEEALSFPIYNCLRLTRPPPVLTQPLGVDFGGVVTPIEYQGVFYLAGFGDGAGHSTARASNKGTYCYIHDTTDAGYSNYGNVSWSSSGNVVFSVAASDSLPIPASARTPITNGASIAGLTGEYLEVGMCN
jgi:hypothetical protein